MKVVQPETGNGSMPDLRRVIPVIIETGLPLQTEKLLYPPPTAAEQPVEFAVDRRHSKLDGSSGFAGSFHCRFTDRQLENVMVHNQLIQLVRCDRNKA